MADWADERIEAILAKYRRLLGGHYDDDVPVLDRIAKAAAAAVRDAKFEGQREGIKEAVGWHAERAKEYRRRHVHHLHSAESLRALTATTCGQAVSLSLRGGGDRSEAEEGIGPVSVPGGEWRITDDDKELTLFVEGVRVAAVHFYSDPREPRDDEETFQYWTGNLVDAAGKEIELSIFVDTSDAAQAATAKAYLERIGAKRHG